MIIAVGISLLSRIQAEIYVIQYSLAVTGCHLWFLTCPDTPQCLEQSNRVAWHRKYWYSRWNFVAISHTSWDIRYSIFTSGYRLPSLISHPDTRQCLEQSNCVAWHRKYWYSRWNFVAISHTSRYICYSIFTSGYRPPSLIYYSPWRVRTSPTVSGPQKWRFPLEVRYREILVTSGL